MRLITRLLPAYLIDLQQQTNIDATIIDIIQSLQFNKGTLNTNCTNCVINSKPQGFLIVSTKGITGKILCPVCSGYLKYHTTEGIIPPPTNPFNSVLVLAKILPADFIEVLNLSPSSDTLAKMITYIIGTLTDVPINTCMQCSGSGKVTLGSTKIICPLCNGYSKTRLQYAFANNKASVIKPIIPLPDPRKNPPINSQP